MVWKLLSPDQWSALGTVVSATIAALNLVVVVILLIYTRNATESARAQAAVAVRTLNQLDIERNIQKGREVLRAQGRLKDLADRLLVLEQALDSLRFAPNVWEAKPSDWHEMFDTVVRISPINIPKAAELEQKLRSVDIRLKRLASAPIDNDNYHRERADLKEFVRNTGSLVAEIWEGLMNEAG